MRRLVDFSLDRLVRSPREGKKWRAIYTWREFDPKAQEWQEHSTTADFGASGYQDYTIHHDRERRRSYRARHEHDLDRRRAGKLYWTQPGVLSWHLLWGNHTSLDNNLKAFRQKIARG